MYQRDSFLRAKERHNVTLPIERPYSLPKINAIFERKYGQHNIGAAARAVGVTRDHLRRMLSGTSTISHATLRKMAFGWGVGLHELLV